MNRATKGVAILIIAIGAAVGATSQTAAFAAASDSHTPVVGMDSGEYTTAAAPGPQGEGHSPTSPQ
ncbi:hypothetical protein SVIO_064450 [Streptomyces violaceusniger]|uniref:Secreted protein n=1 Tax=Streptomyces violaceusniger TaxID=68280 RepID=A0A4D4L3X5_STRVO|nr:hypothetical protein SVIO_064450 [Streptomyces violaceusniger]